VEIFQLATLALWLGAIPSNDGFTLWIVTKGYSPALQNQPLKNLQ
jgi:hypothetical protein